MSSDEGSTETRAGGGGGDPSRQKLERLGRLVGAFAHEIKNPLSTIALNLSLMEEELDENAGAREKRFKTRTQRLRREVDRLHGILEGFLAYVRAPQPRIESISLNLLVRNVTDLVAPELEKEGIALRLLLTEGIDELEADGRLVHQVLLNLVRNAEQALLEVQHARELLVGTSVDASEAGRFHVLSVTDNGPGMSEEAMERCFQPYWSTKPGGSGLGLAITKRFVEDHGGEIRIESQVGVGTRFLVRLPSRSPLARTGLPEEDPA